jgi:uncharacterized protein
MTTDNGIPNHLIKETSPYLLQHAYNPVNWYPWGKEALGKARAENKLLIISIGYAACHWCHVMEHESFEDQRVASLMNEHFICIKVDREERPDIDHIYMNACYILTGRGGWPLNVIALPDQKPVYAATYFPKDDWIRLLEYFVDLKNHHMNDLLKQSAQVMTELEKIQKVPGYKHEIEIDGSVIENIYTSMSHSFDFQNGGSKGAPKFPMPVNLEFLLEYASISGDQEARKFVYLTLEKMASGGIFDHAGGGFSRYSTDEQWHVPHFEKMLYDNAQLVSLYSKAYKLNNMVLLKRTVVSTLQFITNELTSPDGQFYSSIDADSEGTEGKFYTWTWQEIRDILGDEAEVFMDHFGVTQKGNWEHGLNILHSRTDRQELCIKYNLPEQRVTEILNTGTVKLLGARQLRTRPATDDKILTSWNALMIIGFIDAFHAMGTQAYLEAAVTAAEFYGEQADVSGGRIARTYHGKVPVLHGFLDDYSFLLSAFLKLYETTLVIKWINRAELIANQVIKHFKDADSGLFNFTSDEEPSLVGHVVETADNVIASSNAEFATALFRLGDITGNEYYTETSRTMVRVMLPQISLNPSFHARWASLLYNFIIPPVEITVVGENAVEMIRQFHTHYLPGVIFSGGTDDQQLLPLIGKFKPGRTLVYVCRERVCQAPVGNVADALQLAANITALPE